MALNVVCARYTNAALLAASAGIFVHAILQLVEVLYLHSCMQIDHVDLLVSWRYSQSSWLALMSASSKAVLVDADVFRLAELLCPPSKVTLASFGGVLTETPWMSLQPGGALRPAAQGNSQSALHAS